MPETRCQKLLIKKLSRKLLLFFPHTSKAVSNFFKNFTYKEKCGKEVSKIEIS